MFACPFPATGITMRGFPRNLTVQSALASLLPTWLQPGLPHAQIISSPGGPNYREAEAVHCISQGSLEEQEQNRVCVCVCVWGDPHYFIGDL